MNIFILDLDHKLNAKYHCNTHIIKMPTELAQILGTVMDSFGLKTSIKPTHQNHPCTIWAKQSKANFNFTKELCYELCKEYTFRYGKRHKVEDYLEEIFCPDTLTNDSLSTFAQAMPEQYRNKDSVQAYRDYYINEKLCQDGWRWEYKNRTIPEWALV